MGGRASKAQTQLCDEALLTGHALVETVAESVEKKGGPSQWSLLVQQFVDCAEKAACPEQSWHEWKCEQGPAATPEGKALIAFFKELLEYQGLYNLYCREHVLDFLQAAAETMQAYRQDRSVPFVARMAKVVSTMQEAHCSPAKAFALPPPPSLRQQEAGCPVSVFQDVATMLRELTGRTELTQEEASQLKSLISKCATKSAENKALAALVEQIASYDPAAYDQSCQEQMDILLQSAVNALDKRAANPSWPFAPTVQFLVEKMKQQQNCGQLQISVLTWNICYQCMTDVATGSVRRACHSTVCPPNIDKYIQQQGLKDLVGLQEASNWKELVTPQTYGSEGPQLLQQMEVEHYKPGPEDMVTFYNKDWQLRGYVKSWMEDTGRPMMLLFFDNLVAVNMHAGHRVGLVRKQPDFYSFSKHLALALRNSKRGSLFKQGEGSEQTGASQEFVQFVVEQLKEKPIILLGDMNTGFRGVNKVTFFTEPLFKNPNGRTFAGFHRMPTCCDANIKTTQQNARSAFDQILASLPNQVTNHVVPEALPDASDHLPLSATVDLVQ